MIHRTLMLSFLLIGACQLNAADEDKLIEINGQKKYMLGHILGACLEPEDNPFANTDVITYDAQKGFTVVGTVCNVEEKHMKEVALNNYVYTPFYTTKKPAGSSTYENFGAIIVGTKDQTLGEKLHFASMRALMANRQR